MGSMFFIFFSLLCSIHSYDLAIISATKEDRSFCCLLAKTHCEAACYGRRCSSKCLVRCGENGVFSCTPVPCRDVAPDECTPDPPTVPPVTTAPSPTCGEGWAEFGTKCYRQMFELTNHLSAMNNCIRLGGTLASLDSQEEQSFLVSLLSPKGGWLGAVDWLDEGEFSWLDGTIITDNLDVYTNWREEQPNNFLQNQHCVWMRPDGTWDDINCKREENYVCQKILPA